MKANAALPPNYSKYTILEPARKPRFVINAVVTGILLLFIVGWLLVLLTDTLRPAALDGKEGWTTSQFPSWTGPQSCWAFPYQVVTYKELLA